MYPRCSELIRNRAFELRRQGLTLTKIAAELDVTASSVCDWLKAASIPAKTITCICGKKVQVTTLNRHSCSPECAKRLKNRNYRVKYLSDKSFRDKRKAVYLALKLDVMKHYCGGEPHCQCPSGNCKETIPEFLTVDHIHNDGNKERARNKKDRNGAGDHLYRTLKRKNFPPGYRVLCWNCNCGRARTEDFKCPHEQARPTLS